MADLQKIVDELSKLTVLEAADLAKLLTRLIGHRDASARIPAANISAARPRPFCGNGALTVTIEVSACLTGIRINPDAVIGSGSDIGGHIPYIVTAVIIS